MKNWIVPEFQRSLSKQPYEEVKISCDFSDKLPAYFGRLTSATFSAVKWAISDPDTKSAGDDIFAQNPVGLIEAPYLTHAKIEVAGGDLDHDYHVTCRAETEDGQKLEKDFVIRVREQ